MQIKPQLPTHAPPDPEPPTETLLPLLATTSHPVPPAAPPPISKPPHLYFAYGSNLSPTQMAHRCTFNPSLSAVPLGIASLPHWRWHINEAGYANVLPPRGLRVRDSPQTSVAAEKIPISGAQDTVYGVLYEMDSADEDVLDGYEGIDGMAEPSVWEVEMRPREQGEGDYNKWYVDAEVVRWFDGTARMKMGTKSEGEGEDGSAGSVRVLVYVDEERVTVSKPKAEYIPRMNRAMREAEELGVDGVWLKDVMRRFIPEE